VLLLVQIDHAGAYQRKVLPFWAFFAQNLALYNKNNRVILSQALCVIGSLGNLMFKLHINIVVNIKFPRGTYHTIVPSTEELYCLIHYAKKRPLNRKQYQL